jgi:ketopantoate reductase
VKVAIVGGTGAFGRALAKRLAEIGHDEVLVGSRDAERAQSTAEELGVGGGRNQDVVRDVDLVVLAVKSNATLETAKELAGAIGTTPLLCVASDLRFTDEGVLPGRHQGSLAEEVERLVRGPVVSGFQSWGGGAGGPSRGAPRPPSSRAIQAMRSSVARTPMRRRSRSSSQGIWGRAESTRGRWRTRGPSKA